MDVIIADDHAIVRQGIKTLLSQAGHYTIAAEVSQADAVIPAVEQHQPSLLILDYRMPGGDSLHIAQTLKQRNTALKIIVFTGIQSAAIIKRLADSDVDGLLLKDDAPMELAKALQHLKHNKRYVSPLVKPYLEQIEVHLTGRELQLLNLIVLGWSRRKISEHLGITVETIKSYSKSMMGKLNVHTVTELIQKAQELKLLDPL